jgi:ABC-type Fe3+ transport system permease subunit
METSAAQNATRRRRHRRSHHQSRKRAKEVWQRIAILVFLLVITLALLYVWISGGSAETTGELPSQWIKAVFVISSV